jgi:hypothetical protein
VPLALGTPSDGPTPVRETDLDRVLKLVPTEVLAIYAAATTAGLRCALLAIASLILVALILYGDGRATGTRARWPQYVLRMATFAGWVLTLEDVFELQWLGALAILVVPVAGALITRPRAELDW